MYTNQDTKKWLDNHQGRTFFDMITLSDIAIVATFIKNSEQVWNPQASTSPPSPSQEIKPLFTNGSSAKRQFGGTAMNEKGWQYYNNCYKKWSAAKKDPSCRQQFVLDWNSFVASTPGLKFLQRKQGRQYAAQAATLAEAPTINLFDDEEELATETACDKEVEYNGVEEEAGLDGDDDYDEGKVNEYDVRKELLITRHGGKDLKRLAPSKNDDDVTQNEKKKKKGHRK